MTWLRVVIIGPAVGAAIFALFLAASAMSLEQNLPTAIDRVEAAFHSGDLVVNPYQEGSTSIGSHQWNDCLITLMAIDQRGEPARLTISPIIAGFSGPSAPEDNPCAALAALIGGQTPDAELYYYDRYIHGATVLLRYLLPHWGISSVRSLYRTVLSGLLIAGFAVCLIGIALGQRTTSFAMLAVTCLALARFFGLESFSQSLGHGPADSLLAAYTLALALMLFSPTGPWTAVLAAALFGSLTIVFDLFTGGVPLGLAMVIGLSTLAVRTEAHPRGYALSFAAAVAFLGAATVTYLIKLAAVLFSTEYDIFSDIAKELTRYSPLASDGPSLVLGAAEVVHSLGVLVGGMTFLAAASVIGALIAGAYGAGFILARVADPSVRQRAVLLILSLLPIFGWFVAFPNHFLVHAWFMDRILVWLVAAGFGLFVLAVTSRRLAGGGAYFGADPAAAGPDH